MATERCVWSEKAVFCTWWWYSLTSQSWNVALSFSFWSIRMSNAAKKKKQGPRPTRLPSNETAPRIFAFFRVNPIFDSFLFFFLCSRCHLIRLQSVHHPHPSLAREFIKLCECVCVVYSVKSPILEVGIFYERFKKSIKEKLNYQQTLSPSRRSAPRSPEIL